MCDVKATPRTLPGKLQALVYDILPSTFGGRCRKAMLGVCLAGCACGEAASKARGKDKTCSKRKSCCSQSQRRTTLIAGLHNGGSHEPVPIQVWREQMTCIKTEKSFRIPILIYVIYIYGYM